MTSRRRLASWPAVFLGMLLLSSCLPAAGPATAEPFLASLDSLKPAALDGGRKLRVVATTSILADVVSQIGGDAIELQSLIPIGIDPHSFEPTPQDVRTLADADAVFINGFGLESFIAGLIRDAGGHVPVLSASAGIEPLPFADGAGGGGIDPHTWLDPDGVIQWTRNLETALAALDPSHAAAYASRGEAYRAKLAALDAEIRDELAVIPAQERRLVTDHEELGYFAEAYGFTIVGTVIPGASSLAEPSPAQLAALLDKARAQRVRAVFVSSVVNPTIVDAFAADAGIHVVVLYGESLTGSDGPAPSYLALMRYNAGAIAAALTP